MKFRAALISLFVILVVLSCSLSALAAGKPSDKEIADHVQWAVGHSSFGANTAVKNVTKHSGKEAEVQWKSITIKGYQVWMDPIKVWG